MVDRIREQSRYSPDPNEPAQQPCSPVFRTHTQAFILVWIDTLPPDLLLTGATLCQESSDAIHQATDHILFSTLSNTCPLLFLDGFLLA